MFHLAPSFIRFLPLASMFAILLAQGSTLRAQSVSASLQGAVTDPSGARVSTAKAALRNQSTGEAFVSMANGEGMYRFLRVPPGDYDLTVSAPSFGDVRKSGIRLGPGEARRIDAALLTVQGSNEAIEVVAALGGDEGTQLSTGYGPRQMQDLPMALGVEGRNFRNQAFLTATVNPTTQPHRPFAVAGARTRNNNYLIDSNDFNEIQGGLFPGRGPSEQMVPSESIESLQVITHNFKAEYGRQNGSVMNVVTRSGGNAWHGAAYHYLQHDALSARNTFDARKPPVRYNQPGVRIGGPLIENKLFIFGNYEAVIRRTASPLTVLTLSDAQRQRAVASVRPLVALYPQPNLPGTNLFRANLNQVSDTHTFLARADYAPGQRQRLFTRSSYLRSTDDRGFLASRARANSISGPQAHSLHHVFTPGAAVVNEARFNFTRFAVNDTFESSPLLGDPGVNGELGFLIVNGLSSAGYPRYLGRITAQNNFQWTDDLTLLHGAHTWKMGLAARRIQFNNGTYNTLFMGQLRFNNIDQFLAGRAAAYSRNIGNPYIGLRGSEINAYAQDDWQLSRRLALNLGLRYEFNSVPAEVNGLIPEQFRFQPDRNNWAPRAGLAFRLREDGSTMLRAAWGLYYNVLEWDFIGLTRYNPPLVESVANSAPAFPDLLAGATTQIPSGLVIPDRNMRQPYAQHFQATVEQSLGASLLASVGYVGTVASRLARASQPNGGDGLKQALRPDPTVGVVTRLETAANSNYHGLASSLTWRGRSLLLTGSYTWAKSIDQVSDIPNSNLQLPANMLPLNPNDWGLNRGPADTDIRQIANVSYLWELPLFEGRRWLGGWQLAGVLYARSGMPVTLYSGTDTPLGVNTNRILDIEGTLLRDGGGRNPFRLAPGVSRGQITPAAGRYGSIGRNTERSGGYLQWNASVQKRFSITERLRAELRLESFNVLNRANYNVPDAILSSPTFGLATSAFDSRQGQVALRLEF
ncbi:MAG: TonB-dependent receptor [Bryobacterales bacterium]|nr:TonB-dependent receptor [Bryobacterales bacterium]